MLLSKKMEFQQLFFEKTTYLLNLIFRDNELSFWIMTWFHHIVCSLVLLFIILAPTSSIQFKLSIIFYFFWIIFNYFFNGCIFIRLERFILNDDSWFGLFHTLELFNIQITKKNINKTFFSLSIIIYYIILFKIFITR